MKKYSVFLGFVVMAIAGLSFIPSYANATTTDYMVFSDNFDNLNVGSLSGQNGWSGILNYWKVESNASGKEIYNRAGGYESLVAAQTNHELQDSRVKFDFLATVNGGLESTPHVWLRLTSSAPGARGYDVYHHQSEGRFYMGYFNGTSISFIGWVDYPLTPNTWYTMEFEVVNNSSGNPVLNFWAYPKGQSRPVTPTISQVDTLKRLPGAGYAGIGGSITVNHIDNFELYTNGPVASSPVNNLQAVSGLGEVTLNWSAPISNGGSPVSDYVIEYRTGSNPFTTFSDGVSTDTNTTVTGLSLGTLYDFRVSAVNSVGLSNPTTKQLLTNSNITITTPAKSVSASPHTATTGIYRSECNTTFYIPYIQTSDSLTVSANVNAGLPEGGGVKFVLSGVGSNEFTEYDFSAPFSATFNNLAKGEYTLDAYIVDSDQVVKLGDTNYDTATNIGIGDIYVAIGDSVTEGYDGTSYNVYPYTDWTVAPVTSNDNRNYPQCGISEGAYHDHWQNLSHHISLNNKLENYYGYPVFILNEGVAGIRTSGYVTRVGLQSWQDRMNELQPNKWLIHLGINDGNGSAASENNIQSLINTFMNSYGASGEDIVLAVPAVRSGWEPYISSLINNNNLTTGPDFKTFYSENNSPVLYVGVHPNVAGHVEMGRLWGISIISPKNLQATQDSEDIDLSWDDLSTIESSIAGYRIYYGTDPDDLDTVVDVGDTTSTTIDSGLSDDTTYYFAVRGYDGSQTPNKTAISPKVSLHYQVASQPMGIHSGIETHFYYNVSNGGFLETEIKWKTDVPTISKIAYRAEGEGETAIKVDDTYVTDHSIVIPDLSFTTTYNYIIASRDESDVSHQTEDLTFETPVEKNLFTTIQNIQVKPSDGRIPL